MGSFDACFGAGVMAGGAAGTVSAALGARPMVQLAATSALLALALIAVARWLPQEALHHGERGRHLRGGGSIGGS
jgi:hypothetical protein